MTQGRATMADWLALHDVTAAQCRAVLAAPPPPLDPGEDPPWPQDPAHLWQRIAGLLSAGFPPETGLIDQTLALSRTDFSGTSRHGARAFTLQDDGTGHPFVTCHPRGRLSDLLTMAHELGHAAQIVASVGRPMPPATREVCALLAEWWTLMRFGQDEPTLGPAARRIFQTRGAARRAAARQELLGALDRPDATYRYDWNYPLARAIALGTQGGLDSAQMWQVFAGQIGLAQLMARMG